MFVFRKRADPCWRRFNSSSEIIVDIQEILSKPTTPVAKEPDSGSFPAPALSVINDSWKTNAASLLGEQVLVSKKEKHKKKPRQNPPKKEERRSYE